MLSSRGRVGEMGGGGLRGWRAGGLRGRRGGFRGEGEQASEVKADGNIEGAEEA